MVAIFRWMRKGIEVTLVFKRNYRLFICGSWSTYADYSVVMLGLPMGHPLHKVRKKHLHYRLSKNLLDRVVYSGWYRGKKCGVWFIGFGYPWNECDVDFTMVLKRANRLADRVRVMMPTSSQTQATLDLED